MTLRAVKYIKDFLFHLFLTISGLGLQLYTSQKQFP